MKAAICPQLVELTIDELRGTVRVDGKRLQHLVQGTRPFRILVALARHGGECLHDQLYEICDGADPKAAVRDGIRRLREVLRRCGLDPSRLICRKGHGPWQLRARVKLRGRTRFSAR